MVFAPGAAFARDRASPSSGDNGSAMTGYRPIIIGIVGDSGAGKTTFAAGLARVLGVDRTVVICTDDYHRYSRRQRTALRLTPHDPACNYIDILEQHVDLLRAGQPVLKPVYNHQGGVLAPPEYVEPKPFIILEGLLGLATPRLLDAHDVKIFLEPQESLRLRWKLKRDTEWGGYSAEEVIASLDDLSRDSRLFIAPQRNAADMVVSFYPPENEPEESGGRLNVRHLLRPTLPHLDLAPLLERGSVESFELELARDSDGRPVDALHVFGAIGADGQFKRLRDELWSQIAAPGAVLPPLGEYRAARSSLAISPPLALSQLLVGHYLLLAAETAAETC
jgi:phosphoribulokinase